MEERSLLDRLLPAEERATAIWMAIALACIYGAKYIAESLVFRFVTVPRSALGSSAIRELLRHGLPGIVVLVLVWLLIRLTPTPSQIALYLSLSAVISLIRTILQTGVNSLMDVLLPTHFSAASSPPLARVGAALLTSLILVVASVLGAWLAQRPRDTAEPDLGLIAATGWRGLPAEGETRLALGYVVSTAVFSIGNFVVFSLSSLVQQASQHFWSSDEGLLNRVWNASSYLFTPLLLGAGLGLSWLLIRRWHQPVSWWLVYLGVSVAAVLSLFWPLTQGFMSLRDFFGAFWLPAAGLLGIYAAPFLGAWLATRGGAMSEPSGTLPAETHA